MSSAERPAQGSTRAVEAFIELVAERGYQQVELDEVDERAGLAPGAAGRLFPDRLSYFHAGWDLLEAGLIRRLRSAYQPVSGWRNQLRAAAEETANLLERFPGQAHFLAVDALSVGDPGRKRQRRLAARLAVYFDQARADSEHSSSAPAATSGWVIGLFFDRIYRCSASGREDSFAAELPELMFLAVSAYFGPEAGLAELEQNSS